LKQAAFFIGGVFSNLTPRQIVGEKSPNFSKIYLTPHLSRVIIYLKSQRRLAAFQRR
jgi:hypothetical protein